MANEDSALREVDQELAEERQWAMFRQYGPGVIAGAAAVVLVVGGWQFWKARQASVAGEQSLEFKNAVELLAETPDEGRSAVAAIADAGDGGYSVLARLHQAAALSQGGDRLGALEAYRAVAETRSVPKPIRELARLRAAYHALADGRDAVMAELDGLDETDSINGFYARELLGLSTLQEKDFETAHALFTQLTTDLGAPAALRERAGEFAALAASGRAGVNITGETRIDDLVESLSGPAATDDLDAAQDSLDNAGDEDAAETADAEEADANEQEPPSDADPADDAQPDETDAAASEQAEPESNENE